MTLEEFDEIENYLQGKLDPLAKAAFQHRLDHDTDFREQVDVFTKLNRGIRQEGRNQLRKATFPPSKIPFMVKLGANRKVTIPVSIIALLLIAFWATLPSGNDELFSDYYSKIEAINFSKPRGESGDYQIKKEAFEAFQAGEYEKAKSLLSKLSLVDQESSLLAGVIFIQLEELDSAEANLKVAKEGTASIATEAQWYLALVYLKKGDMQKAKAEFQAIVQLQNRYSPMAAELIEKLKQN